MKTPWTAKRTNESILELGKKLTPKSKVRNNKQTFWTCHENEKTRIGKHDNDGARIGKKILWTSKRKILDGVRK